MSFTNHVVSRELAEELRDAGWPQEGSTFYWSVPKPDAGNTENEKRTLKTINAIIVSSGISYGPCFTNVAAPLASELMERMPGGYFAYRRGSSWLTGKDLHHIAVAVANDSMPDALARLALHLIKEGILKL